MKYSSINFLKYSILISLIIVFYNTLAIAGEDKPDIQCIKDENNGKCSLFSVSIIDLLSNPKDYHNKKVLVIGYFSFEFEGNAIYLSYDDYLYGITKNGFWVSFTPETIKAAELNNNSYVAIEGTFNKNDFGHLSMWSGSIHNITRIIKMERIGKKVGK